MHLEKRIKQEWCISKLATLIAQVHQQTSQLVLMEYIRIPSISFMCKAMTLYRCTIYHSAFFKKIVNSFVPNDGVVCAISPMTMYCFTILSASFIYIKLVFVHLLSRRGVGEVSQRSRVFLRKALWTWWRAHGKPSSNSLIRIVATNDDLYELSEF